MITATLRSDASSRFAKDNRWGLFPSVALGWKISQEAFLRDSEVLSDLKLRLSYGQTGQQDILNDYPYMTTFYGILSGILLSVWEINGTIPIVRTVMTRISSGRLPKLIISVWITVSLIIAFTVLSIITNAIRRIC